MRIRWIAVAVGLGLFAASCASETVVTASGSPGQATGVVVLDPETASAAMAEIASGFVGPAVSGNGFALNLAEARRSWAVADVSTYYYEVEALSDDSDGLEGQCGFNEPLIVEVVGRVVESVNAKWSGCSTSVGDVDRVPLTVEEWFDYFSREVAEYGDAATELSATFAENGSPVAFFVLGPQRFTEVQFREFGIGEQDASAADSRLGVLADQRELWVSSGIASYRMSLEVGCLCPVELRGPFDIYVEDGVVLEALFGGKPASGQAVDEWFTVEGLFAKVERLAHSDELTVTYDVTYGFPAYIDSDPDDQTFDDELRLTITGFEKSDSR